MRSAFGLVMFLCAQIHTSRMNLSDDVDLEEFILSKDELSGADVKVGLAVLCPIHIWKIFNTCTLTHIHTYTHTRCTRFQAICTEAGMLGLRERRMKVLLHPIICPFWGGMRYCHKIQHSVASNFIYFCLGYSSRLQESQDQSAVQEKRRCAAGIVFVKGTQDRGKSKTNNEKDILHA